MAIQSGNRVVVTSRIYGYRAAALPGTLPHITVLDFRREEIELFARQWFRELTHWEQGGTLTSLLERAAQERERKLLDDIRNNPGVERLAVNPLLLTMLALLGRWFAVGYCGLREAQRVFRLDRILRVEEGGDPFERPEVLDLLLIVRTTLATTPGRWEKAEASPASGRG